MADQPDTENKDSGDFMEVGDNFPAIKIKEKDEQFRGTIVKIPSKTVTIHPKNGDPDYQSLPITIDLKGAGNEEDFGTFWINKFGVKKAIKEACEKVAPGTRLAVGGTLGVKVTGFEKTDKPSPMTLYSAVYKPPAVTASDAVDDFFDA